MVGTRRRRQLPPGFLRGASLFLPSFFFFFFSFFSPAFLLTAASVTSQHLPCGAAPVESAPEPFAKHKPRGHRGHRDPPPPPRVAGGHPVTPRPSGMGIKAQRRQSPPLPSCGAEQLCSRNSFILPLTSPWLCQGQSPAATRGASTQARREETGFLPCQSPPARLWHSWPCPAARSQWPRGVPSVARPG